jgi:hypothetical protein
MRGLFRHISRRFTSGYLLVAALAAENGNFQTTLKCVFHAGLLNALAHNSRKNSVIKVALKSEGN